MLAGHAPHGSSSGSFYGRSAGAAGGGGGGEALRAIPQDYDPLRVGAQEGMGLAQGQDAEELMQALAEGSQHGGDALDFDPSFLSGDPHFRDLS
eukprot:TRINITY_DN1685_c0_g1_i1.p2 TRINITY_DN1685_c0_g1~~TRINITY_DN1685_c0_g1_i1.p2  ORF type:complete len:106 (+),score=44.23 TRINITY_DN1685_c0_g1_i1:39-320(+)